MIFLFLSFSALANNNYTSHFDLQSINFVQNTIDVSKSDKTLYFSLRAYSQLGLNRVIVYFQSPSGKETVETSCVNKKKTKVGLLLGRVLFKKKSEIGEWIINKIVIEDLEGNQHAYDKDFLIANNFTHSLFVKSKGNRLRK